MTKFIIGSGQSGAVGGKGMEGGDQTVNDRVFVWTDNGWQVAVPGQPPFAASRDPYNNVLWNACKELQASTGEDVYFVLSGKGGTPISEWAEGAQQWGNLDAAVTSAMASPELAGHTVADYFFWYHGGSDAESTTYTDDFLDLRDRMVGKGWLADDTITVTGETHKNSAANEAILNLLAGGDAPWLRMAENDGLSWYGVHPVGDSCVAYGRRWFEQIGAPSSIPGKYMAYDSFDFGWRYDDTLSATGNTLVLAAAGDDFVYVSGEGSYAFGGKGDDVFRVEGVSDTTIVGGSGEDRVHIHLAFGEDTPDVTLINIERVRVHYGEPVLF